MFKYVLVNCVLKQQSDEKRILNHIIKLMNKYYLLCYEFM